MEAGGDLHLHDKMDEPSGMVGRGGGGGDECTVWKYRLLLAGCTSEYCTPIMYMLHTVYGMGGECTVYSSIGCY
jgi:hypothetical protein